MVHLLFTTSTYSDGSLFMLFEGVGCEEVGPLFLNFSTPEEAGEVMFYLWGVYGVGVLRGVSASELYDTAIHYLLSEV